MLGRLKSSLPHIHRITNSLQSVFRAPESSQEDEQEILLGSNRRTESSRILHRQGSSGTLHDIVEENEDEEDEAFLPSYITDNNVSSASHSRRISPILLLVVVIGIGWTIGLYLTYPFPTTIPIFIGLLIILFGWTITTLTKLSVDLILRKESSSTILSKYSTSKEIRLGISTLFLIYLLTLGSLPPPREVPALLPAEISGVKQKYFIAANMHNNESVLSQWSEQLIRLISHLGKENTFVSIYESNSKDSTKTLLSTLNNTLENLSTEHRIITENDNKHWWPYGTAIERIGYLANARNIAMEPIQSENNEIRLDNHREFTKILFLNDIWFNWEDVIGLLDTRFTNDDPNDNDEITQKMTDFGDYDQVCALDFGASGLYDTWVARDICGTPLRAFWPYVKDPISIKKIQAEEPFEVSACWNGVTALNAEPFLYRDPEEKKSLELSVDGSHLRKRGWRMVDNSTYPGSVSSPPINLPIQFRTSNISQCDHSECFLISYDLHRYHSDRRAKIYMNPKVKVTYDQNWFKWHQVILRIPIIRWWLVHWSRGYPLYLVNWIWEYFGRKRDYCTWSALTRYSPERCPALPGPVERPWDQ